MIRSMTGFGEASRALAEGQVLRVELRSVNHRFLNTSLRLLPGLERLEGEVQGWLRPHIQRGHVQGQVLIESPGGGSSRELPLPEVDLERARHYAGLLRRLRDELGLAGAPDVLAVARFGDVFRVPDTGPRGALVDPELLRELVDEAARALVAMREAEGARLAADLEGRLAVLAHESEQVRALAPERLLRERDRLRAAVRELTQDEEVDPDRLAREVAFLAERWDVSEELVRLAAHLDAFRDALASPASDGVGKRLSFLVQEMHREVNTIGSKANDARIAHATVAMKEEIERLREQVENVE